MSAFIQDLADRLAKDVLDAQTELKDERFYDQVGRVLMAASPTLQEYFMTSIRIRLAEARGRAFLEQALKAKREGGAAPDAPKDLSLGSGH
ncbi:hypothetical protein HOY34_17135 [Xinfangfangia sp. D13-10-4-6]|uniref:hypothetical protein n=1 Tax=Pseudogemmobacter hezensis TaxID=2737662 RepID=UPI001552B81D|nr:hypothetical protein [Pseudogemmobacter hezensis]NPD16920.1 hypothetical protein [Pseudogemmobacter hezensis]